MSRLLSAASKGRHCSTVVLILAVVVMLLRDISCFAVVPSFQFASSTTTTITRTISCPESRQRKQRQQESNAFIRQTTQFTVSSFSTLHLYRDDGSDMGNTTTTLEEKEDGSYRLPRKQRGLTIPLIGPIPNAPPLILGADMMLNPPTPLQWKALEESVVVHKNFEQKHSTTQDQHDDDNPTSSSTAIDAAPLVAIIDETSGYLGLGDAQSGRYATLAAVVGITYSRNDNDASSLIDTNDETSFMESVMRAGRRSNPNNNMDPMHSSVRLVGIGRAKLTSYFYTAPTDLDMEITHDDDDDDDDDVENEYDDDVDTPIVMAEFQLLKDDELVSSSSKQSAKNNIGERGAFSAKKSPVHAMAELNRVLNRVLWAHDDRRRLVSGLKAAKARLNMRDIRQQQELDDDEDKFAGELEDYDGLGMIGGGDDLHQDDESNDLNEGEMTVDEFLSTFMGNKNKNEGSTDDDSSQIIVAEPGPADRVEAMDNYGLNYYSAFSAIQQLTTVALQVFEPYYSEEHREREEYEIEVTSFVAFRALDGFASPQDMAWALKCTCSAERLERAYDLMTDHKMRLKELAERISDELRECGEECTDLW